MGQKVGPSQLLAEILKSDPVVLSESTAAANRLIIGYFGTVNGDHTRLSFIVGNDPDVELSSGDFLITISDLTVNMNNSNKSRVILNGKVKITHQGETVLEHILSGIIERDRQPMIFFAGMPANDLTEALESGRNLHLLWGTWK